MILLDKKLNRWIVVPPKYIKYLWYWSIYYNLIDNWLDSSFVKYSKFVKQSKEMSVNAKK